MARTSHAAGTTRNGAQRAARAQRRAAGGAAAEREQRVTELGLAFRAVSRALHGVGVNIVSLETTAYEAPVTGSPLFRMEERVDVPQATGVARVRKAMDDVAVAENLDIEVRSLIARGG